MVLTRAMPCKFMTAGVFLQSLSPQNNQERVSDMVNQELLESGPGCLVLARALWSPAVCM